MEACKIGKAQPSHRLGNLYLAGQPQAEDFQLAKEQGIKTVLNLRKKGELTWDEEAQVKKLGLTHINLPFASPAELKDDVFDQARKVGLKAPALEETAKNYISRVQTKK